MVQVDSRDIVRRVLRDGIRQAPVSQGVLEQAMKTLEEVIGQTMFPVTAEWDCGKDAQGRWVIILRLSDFSGSVTATFDSTELEDTKFFPRRLNRLWSRLLQIRTDKLLANLLGTENGTER